MNSGKRDWGWAFAGLTMLLVGVLFLSDGRQSLLYNVTIHPRGPLTWMGPWQAVITGSLCFLLGVVVLLSSLGRR